MPPSGFSQEAINGLLTFVRATYENTLERYRGGNLSEPQQLANIRSYLTQFKLEEHQYATVRI